MRQVQRDQAVQGCLGDAWLIAALGAVAGHRPEAIQGLLRKQPNGDARIELHQVGLERSTADWVPTGQSIVLEISPEVPVNPYNPELSYFADRSHSKAVWPALLEKAFAEIDRWWSSARREAIPERGYERLDTGGSVWEAAEILAQLTGCRAGIMQLNHGKQQDRNALVLAYLLAMRRPVLIGTKPPVGPEARPEYGLYPGHAYEITRVENGTAWLRNPWGTGHANVPLSRLVEATGGTIATVKD